MGKKVILVEQDKRLGGVCLIRGCVPFQGPLARDELLAEAKESSHHGISFETPRIELAKLRAWKESIVTKLSQADRRSRAAARGSGHRQRMSDSNTLRVETTEGKNEDHQV